PRTDGPGGLARPAGDRQRVGADRSFPKNAIVLRTATSPASLAGQMRYAVPPPRCAFVRGTRTRARTSTKEKQVMPAGVHEAFMNVGGAQIRLLKGGSGAPLLVLHGTEGSLGWRRYAQALAEHFTVYLPSHPGFDGSQRPVWLQSMCDLACFYTWFQETQGLEGVPVIGCALGGWLAAEMATTTSHAFSKMLLVHAPGIRPQDGGLTDLF